MEMEKVNYYEKAILWAENYLERNTEPKRIVPSKGHIIENDILYVSTSLARLKFSKGREQQASYNRLRLFKQYLESII